LRKKISYVIAGLTLEVLVAFRLVHALVLALISVGSFSYAATQGKRARPIVYDCAPQILLAATQSRTAPVVAKYDPASTLSTLTDLVAFRSYSQTPDGKPALAEAADYLVREFKALTPQVELMPVPEGKGGPMLLAQYLDAGDTKPTLLMYAHYDVVAAGDPALWTHGTPYKLVISDGRIYGRGTSDDKGNIAVMLAALRAYKAAGVPFPVNWKILLEGNEENGSNHMGDFLRENADRLRADVLLAMDGRSYEVDVPGIEVSARGFNIFHVDVTANYPTVHSGLAGGFTPVASLEMISALGKLSPSGMYGRLAIEDQLGLNPLPSLTTAAGYSRDALATDLKIPVDFIAPEGEIPLHLINTHRPSMNIVDLRATPVGAAGPSSIHHSAGAKIVVRTVAPMEIETTRRLIEEFIAANVARGLTVTVTADTLAADPWSMPIDHPAVRVAHFALTNAFNGTEPRYMGTGGALPILLQAEHHLDRLPIIFWGVSDGGSNLHSPDESIGVANLDRAVVALIQMLDAYGQGTVTPHTP